MKNRLLVSISILLMYSLHMIQAQTIVKIPFKQNALFSVSPSSFEVELEPQNNKEIGLEITINGGSGQYTFTWLYQDEVVGVLPSLTVNKAGVYTLTISDGEGCESSVIYTVLGETGLVNTDYEPLISLYPNPASDHVYAKVPDNINFSQVSIYTIEGKHLKTYTSENIKQEKSILYFDLSEFSSGYYLMSFVSLDEVFTKIITLK